MSEPRRARDARPDPRRHGARPDRPRRERTAPTTTTGTPPSQPPTAGSRDEQRAELVAIVEPAVQAAGLDLEDLRLSQAGRRRRLQLLVDKDGGVDLDECADLSRAVSRLLDARDPFGPDPYVLEVSSPGVSRPLTLARHWRRNVGRLVRIDRVGEPSVVGRIVSTSDDAATLALAGDRASLTVRLGDVARAVVQVELSRPDEDE